MDKNLVEQLKAAIDAGDFKAVGKLAKDIAQSQAAEEKAAREKRQKGLLELTGKVMKDMQKVVASHAEELSKAKADGVWFFDDNVSHESDCRLIKRKVRAGGTGGGGGQRYAVSTTDLLAAHGDAIVGGEGPMSGMTFNDAWASTTEKNARYQLRVKMIKLAGIAG